MHRATGAKATRGQRGLLRVLLALMTAVLVIAAAGFFVFLQLGHWLVLEDPLAPARAIAVLSGRMPSRAIEAARLYRRHYAPEVWLTHSQGQQKALRAYGISYLGEEEYNREVLEKLGVPASSIRILEPPIVNTEDEVQVIAKELRRVGGQRVILVSSAPHTRRVKTIWHELVGNEPEAIVHYTRADSFDADRWWGNTADALDVVREALGLLNAWAGFPVQPQSSLQAPSFPQPGAR